MPEFFVLNEVGRGQDPSSPADVSVYASRDAVERDLEPWFEDEPHMLLTNTGRRKALTAANGRIQIDDSPDAADYSALARRWLVYRLEAVVNAKEHRRAEPIGRIDFEPMSTDDLCRLNLLF